MKVQIIALPRSGSSYLRSMLDLQMNDLDNYFTISEPFNESKGHILTPNEIINLIKANKNVLVKTMIFEKTTNEFNKLFDYTICLSRKNLFEATLSRIISLTTNKWHEEHDTDLQLSFDFSYFKQFLDETVYWDNELLNKHCHARIFYEDLSFKSYCDLKKINLLITHKTNYNTTLLYSKNKIVTNYSELQNESMKYLKTIKVNRVLQKSGIM